MQTEDISRKVSKDLNIKFDIVDKIHKIQYKFMMEVMKDANSDIKLIHIGKFVRKRKNELRKTRTDIRRLEESDN